ncbi:UNVERIFIED_CONTAM: Autophagy protein 5 [Sesamum radiatum]|uniref:Autophagy protein 5 n=1 Tax=Sesamum radiatum TaxID=300843 RepID=A0AAW2VPS0_SESRA
MTSNFSLLVPVRLYIRTIDEDIDDLEDAPAIGSWEKVSYINRPVEVHSEGICFSLNDALKALLPELFTEASSTNAHTSGAEAEGGQRSDGDSSRNPGETGEAPSEHTRLPSDGAEIKLVRIQGIEPQLEIPFGWVVNNLMNPDHYLHICVYVKVLEPITI